MIESKDTHFVAVENERLRYDNSDLLAQADADSHVIRQLEDLVAAYKAKLEEAVKVLEPIVAVIEASEVHARLNGNDPDRVPDTHEVTPYKVVPNVTLGHLRALKSFLENLKGAE